MNNTLKSLLIASAFTTPSIYATSDTILETVSDTQDAAAALSKRQLALVQAIDHHDETTAKLLELRPDLSFIDAFNLLFDLKTSMIITMSKTPTELINQINKNANLDRIQKQTLTGALLKATPEDILDAAYSLRDLGKKSHEGHPEQNKFYERSAALFELAANHQNSKPLEISRASLGLRLLGNAYSKNWEAQKLYHDRSAALLEQSITYAFAFDIIRAAANFKILGDCYPEGRMERKQFHERSAALYELAAYHHKATPEDLKNAASTFKDFGDTYSEGSSERKHYHDKSIALLDQYYIRSALLSDTPKTIPQTSCDIPRRPEDILKAAHGFRALGNQHPKDSVEQRYYHDKSADLLEQIANHEDAHPKVLQDAAQGFKILGDQYPESRPEQKHYHNRSADLLELASKQSTFNLLDGSAAQGSPAFKNQASKALIERNHPNNNLEESYKYTHQDKIRSTLLNTRSKVSFIDALKLLLDPQNSMSRTTPDIHKKLVYRFTYDDKFDAKFNETQKEILIGALPNGTHIDLMRAIHLLLELGDACPESSTERKQIHDMAATACELAANRPSEKTDIIQFAAQGLKSLGDQYPKSSAERKLFYNKAEKAYELVANHPNATSSDIKDTTDSLRDLGNEYPKYIAERLEHTFTHTTSAPTERESTHYQNEITSQLLELDSGLSFIDVLNLVLDPKLSISRTTSEIHTALVDRIKSDAKFDMTQKKILIGALPNATQIDIMHAIHLLSEFADQYPKGSAERKQFHNRSATLYELAAKHPSATKWDIKDTADSLRDLGNQYPEGSAEQKQFHERSATLYELAANHPSTNILDIIDKAVSLFELGNQYPKDSSGKKQFHYRSSKIFEQAANHPKAESRDVLNAANSLRDLGNQHSKGSVEQKYFQDSYAALIEKSLNYSTSTQMDILNAADSLRDLGNEYPEDSAERKQFYNRSASLYELSARHPSAPPQDIQFAAYSLDVLGFQYPEGSAERLRYTSMANALRNTITH